jgi:hypothetical protein
MAINNAVKLINRIRDSRTLRASLYTCENPIDLENYVKSLGYSFTYSEFEDAYRKLLLSSHSHEDAFQITEICNMYLLLLGKAPLETY